MITRRLALSLVLTGLVAGCARTKSDPGPFAATETGPYVLDAGDRLRVLVFGQENLSNLYAVDAKGAIAMPLIGTVPAAGMTTEELATAIKARLRKGFLRDPDVVVEVDQYRPFFILGEVANPGQFAYINGLTAQTAIAVAGGFAPRADRTGVDLTRQIDGVIRTARLSLATPIRPGDTITVTERWF
jgi:polysaccharide export outer membrane protein